MQDLVQYIFAGALSGILGIAELLSRYRDEPEAIFRLMASYLYALFNVLIGVAALYAIHVIEPSGLVPSSSASPTEALRIGFYQVLVAGFGGAAFFRTAIAKTKVGDMEIGVGPSFVIDTFLGTTDRSIDRQRAQNRTSTIPEKMRGIPPQFAAVDLTDFCVTAMQNLPAEHEKTLKTRTASYASSQLDDNVKSMLIGFAITEYVGPNVLSEAITRLDSEIQGAKSAEAENNEDHSTSPDLLDQVRAARLANQGAGSPTTGPPDDTGNP